jgi:hypothetical protein
MNRLALSVLLFVLSSAPQAPAWQQSAGSQAASSQAIDLPAKPNLVFDDDGGQTQIVPANVVPGAQKHFHGGQVMKSVQQVSIFIGAAWGDPQVRTRETALLDLGATQTTELGELRINQVRVMGAAQGMEDFTDLTDTRVNDLTIQHELAAMLAGELIPSPTPSTIYVIYLPPGINSFLGSHKAETDYAAYHNLIHLNAGEVRYVVVPFHADADHHGAAAARAFVDAALNPNGDGWF